MTSIIIAGSLLPLYPDLCLLLLCHANGLSLGGCWHQPDWLVPIAFEANQTIGKLGAFPSTPSLFAHPNTSSAMSTHKVAYTHPASSTWWGSGLGPLLGPIPADCIAPAGACPITCSLVHTRCQPLLIGVLPASHGTSHVGALAPPRAKPRSLQEIGSSAHTSCLPPATPEYALQYL